jgi:tetratricopeptide (TPR) repeat protein
LPHPFDNETGQEQYDPAAAGVADLIAVMLAQQDSVVVVERQKLEALTAEQAKTLKGLTGEQFALSAGKVLQADTVLTGRLFLIQDKLTISVKALDIASARVVASDQLSCRPEDLPETALQFTRNLAKQMQVPLPEIDLKKIDTSPLASLHFAKALGHYYAGDMDSAIMQFMRTVDLDPDYSEAHYWAALCYAKTGEDAHAIIELEQFLKRQPASKHSEAAKKLLAEAQQREKDSPVPRLGPTSQTSKPAGATTKAAATK